MDYSTHAYNRQSRCYEPIPVVAGRWMRWTYQTPAGRMALHALIKRKFVSSVYGRYCRTRRSVRTAQRLIDTFSLDMTPFEPFDSYTSFFTRTLAQVDMPSAQVLGAWSEGFCSVWEDLDPARVVQVKDDVYDLPSLLADAPLAESFRGGTMLRIRLAPQHYHHFHWFDDGVVRSVRDIPGSYFSVHPLALRQIARLYCQNKRRIIVADTATFGPMVLVEVGATMIGSIHNPFIAGDSFVRGADGGHFAPGGSMLLGLFQKGRLRIDTDLIEQTSLGFESIVHLGERVGEATHG